MIFLTGDTHGEFKDRFSHENFPQKTLTTKKDIVIILGDFGGVFTGGAAEQAKLDWLNSQPFTTAFIDGNHENFELLDKLPRQKWHGGYVSYVRDSIIHLKRGQFFDLGKTFFVMGGAPSIDKDLRTPYLDWWPEEIPSSVEYDCAINRLQQANWRMDYVLTHTVPNYLIEEFMPLRKVYDKSLDKFLKILLETSTYTKHYFGHFHKNLRIHDKHELLYDKIIQVE